MDAIQSVRQHDGRYGQTANGGRSLAGAKAGSTLAYAGPSFLAGNLRPVRLGHPSIALMEQRFFRSAKHLCAYYGLPPVRKGVRPFPYNLNVVYLKIKKRLAALKKPISLYVATGSQAGYLATSEPLYIPDGLIPIDKIAGWLKRRTKSSLCAVLVPALAYLRKVGMAYYMDEDTMLYHVFNDVYMAYMGGEDDGYGKYMLKAAGRCADMGHYFYPFIKEPPSIDGWSDALANCHPTRQLDIALKAVSAELLALYKRYPKRTLNNNFTPNIFEDSGRNVASLCFGINCEINVDWHIEVNEWNEMVFADSEDNRLPSRNRIFDRPDPLLPDLTFEHLLIGCINQLYYLLSNEPTWTI